MGLSTLGGALDRSETLGDVSEAGATGGANVCSERLDANSSTPHGRPPSRDLLDSHSKSRAAPALAEARRDKQSNLIFSADLTVGPSTVPLSLTAEHSGAARMGRVVLARENVGFSWNQLGMIRGAAGFNIELWPAASGLSDGSHTLTRPRWISYRACAVSRAASVLRHAC